jgi:hypothetical protein
MVKVKAEDFDHPLIFLVGITFGVVGVIAILSWVFASLGWTGPLGLMKGGVVQ